ncbi:MAG: EamA family transporter [Clostridia bacterium]|nr:EamA family transporter [Clostridia bacterium]
MSWFMFALIAILFWSGSDLFSKLGSRPDDPYSHWKMVMAVGTVMGLHAFYMMATGTPFEMMDIVRYLPASLLYIFSMILGYAGLRYIELSISSPICNCSGAVAALLCYLLLGETMSGLQLFAVVLVTVAVFGLAVLEKQKDDALRLQEGVVIDRKYQKGVIAFVFPLLYCLLDGLGTYADALLLDTVIAEEQANIAYELTFLMMAVFAFIYIVCIKKAKFELFRERPKVIAALCETAGQFAYVYALGANAIVAAPMISSYCVVSTLWSRLFLKEKLSKAQYAILFVAFVGIAILGME